MATEKELVKLVNILHLCVKSMEKRVERNETLVEILMEETYKLSLKRCKHKKSKLL